MWAEGQRCEEKHSGDEDHCRAGGAVEGPGGGKADHRGDDGDDHAPDQGSTGAPGEISGPVVSRWIFGFAEFLNCCGINELGV